MTLTPGTRVGPYEILGSIGQGGMGQVFRARDTRLKREVALKVLPDSFAGHADRRARFEREAQVLGSLNHTNIAQVFGVEDAGGEPVIAMELVPGPTLSEHQRGKTLPVEEALAIDGGIWPVWSPTGREIFYRGTNNMLMSVQVETASEFQSSRPRSLFDATPYEIIFSVASDGKRLLMISTVAAETSATQIHLVTNFLAELRQRVK